MRFVLVLALTVLAAGPALAEGFKPAVIFAHGNIEADSYYRSAWRGVKRFESDHGVPVKVLRPEGTGHWAFDDMFEAGEQAVAKGADPVLTFGIQLVGVVAALADRHPGVRFIHIDNFVDRPNVQSIRVDEHDGAFLVGMLAAMATKTGRVGFIGGMDVPVIRRFACGYAQGVFRVRPKAEVIWDMASKGPDGFNAPERGRELATHQFQEGIDVVFHASGTTGQGVIEAAAESGRLAIGVNVNENGIRPGFVLTSMVKRIEVITDLALRDASIGRWAPGLRTLGLDEKAVGWSLDKNNAALITPDMQERVERAEFDIASGILVVHDYEVDNSCPVLDFSAARRPQ